MPSTLVHVALAGLLAAGLLGAAFDRRSLLVVLAVTAVPDLDAFAGLVIPGGHRSVLHTSLIPLAAGALLYYDTRRREPSFVRERWGERGVRIGWVSVAAYALAAIGLDLVTGGANVLYPVHDQFYRFSGRVFISNQRGLVQTFVELGGESPGPKSLGSSKEVHVGTAVDPEPGTDPEGAERIVPFVWSGWQLLLVVTSVVVVGVKLRLAERDGGDKA